jgi:hypothetical protein
MVVVRSLKTIYLFWLALVGVLVLPTSQQTSQQTSAEGLLTFKLVARTHARTQAGRHEPTSRSKNLFNIF